MSVSSSSATRSLISTDGEERPIMSINLTTRRARLAFILRSLVTILILTSWSYGCGWILQMLLVFANYNNNKNALKLGIVLSILLALMSAAWMVIAICRTVWKKRQTRHYWMWRPANGDQEWTRSTPPSMFFHVSFREVFLSSDERMCTNEEIKQSSIRILVAFHVWPIFMIFVFWPFYLFLLHKNFNGWHLSLPSSLLLLVFASILYKYVFLGFNSRSSGEDEQESFFLFPDQHDQDPELSTNLLIPQQEEQQPDGPSSTEQEEDYRDVDNL